MLIAESWAYKLVGSRKAEVVRTEKRDDKEFLVLKRFDVDDHREDLVSFTDPENKYQKYLLKNMNRTR